MIILALPPLMGKLWYLMLVKINTNGLKNAFIYTILQKFTNMKFGQGTEWRHTILDNPSSVYQQNGLNKTFDLLTTR